MFRVDTRSALFGMMTVMCARCLSYAMQVALRALLREADLLEVCQCDSHTLELRMFGLIVCRIVFFLSVVDVVREGACIFQCCRER